MKALRERERGHESMEKVLWIKVGGGEKGEKAKERKTTLHMKKRGCFVMKDEVGKCSLPQ